MNIDKITQEIEAISKAYVSQFNIEPDDDWYILKLQEELGELIQAYLMMVGQARQKGKTKKEITESFNKEVADVFAHTLLLAKHFKVNLPHEIKGKWLSWGKATRLPDSVLNKKHKK